MDNNVYVINMDKSIDRLKKISLNLSKNNIKFERIEAIYGKDMSTEDINENTTLFCNTFCTKGMIGCFLSHKKAWNQVVKNGNDFAMILEDDCELVDNFTEKVNKCLIDLYSIDPEWDFLYLGYFGPGNNASMNIFSFLQSIFLKKINTKQITSDYIFVPVSPVGFHSYIISNKCAHNLIKKFNKASYHVDVEFLNNSESFNVYATREKLGNQFSTAENSTLTEHKFPIILNYIFDKFKDENGISYSYYLATPFIEIATIQVNLYLIAFILFLFFCSNSFVLIFFLLSELIIGPENINLIVFWAILACA